MADVREDAEHEPTKPSPEGDEADEAFIYDAEVLGHVEHAAIHTARDGGGAAARSSSRPVRVYGAARTVRPAVGRFREASIASADVERAIYDRGFAEQMKTCRLARARRASDWPEQWLAIEEEFRARRARARALLGDWATSVALHDGHVAEVVLTASALLEQGSQLLMRAPWVRHLHVTSYAEVGPALFACPSLRGMQSLGLRAGELGDDDVDELTASPFVDGLRWLDLAHNRLGQRSLEALASSPVLSRLEYLGFEGNAVESPIDRFGTDSLDGAVVDSNYTAAGRALERLAGRTLHWLHAPDHFPHTYPPSPIDVAMSV